MIDRALLDRMEVIDLGGYTQEEKVHIANVHLLPKQRQTHALERKSPTEEQPNPEGPEAPLLHVTPEAVQDLIGKWTMEAGVRSLERKMAELCRFAALRLARELDGKTRRSPGSRRSPRRRLWSAARARPQA